MKLVPFDQSMIPELLTLQNSLYEEKRHWTLEDLKGELLDGGRKEGRNVLVLLEEKEIRGFGGYVETSAEVGEFYIAPLVVETAAQASLLMAPLIQKARKASARMVRVSAFPGEAKIQSLGKGGFEHKLDFLTLELPLEKRKITPDLNPLTPLIRQTRKNFVPEKFLKLHNRSFCEVDNSPPMELEEAQKIWDSPQVRPENSQLWSTGSGDYAGYLILSTSGFIDSVAVAPEHHRKGLAKAMVSLALEEAFQASFTAVKAIISSNNTPSLRLHQSLGFEEWDRRWVFEKAL